MGEWKIEDMTLPALFEQARKIHSMDSESDLDQEMIKKGCEALEKCEEMISNLGLFSANETKDDISTTNLKYLLVPFYLVELTEKLSHRDRLEVIKSSQEKLKKFITFCEVMELVPEEELENSAQESSDTPVARRAKKIARFRRQRAAETKLQEIKERKERRGRSLKASALSTPIENGEEDALDDDGEEEREAWLTTISLAICKSFDLLEMLKKEEEMLSAVKEKHLQEGDKELAREILDERSKTAEAWHRNAAMRAPFTKPAQPITCATFAQDVVEGRAKVSQAHEHKHQPLIFGPQSLIAGRITSERERMAAQVFQPGHRLPTMSIEEAGLKEMEMMNKWQEMNLKLFEEANSSWHSDRPKPGPTDEDDEDDDEASQQKARAWDDWKDDNPRGAGNKKLTPCG
ncbi:TAP42-like protein [Macleaya cordata]|uniref:PP2A regulatory subunit TAP46 n=1 Tax=Macleaya cordata TaxID=56857 RepID=A0A200QCR9_MACCD|nr:TAP42-like protein [Macleaya cordata]